MEAAIEENLVHLEEFCGTLDIIRNDNTLCVEQVLPRVIEKSKEMEDLYKEIEKIEKFVDIVKGTINSMEIEVTKAEELFKNQNKVKKFFSSIWSNKSNRNRKNRRSKYVAPEILSFSQYLSKSSETIADKVNEDHLSLKQSSSHDELDHNTDMTEKVIET